MTSNPASPPQHPGPPASAVERFRASMAMTLDRWRDGIGYDLDALAAATPDERARIEALLLQHGVRDWCDVQALAALDTPAARQALRLAHERADEPLKVALMTHAAALFDDDERTEALVRALQVTEVYGGLTQALLMVEDHHPQPVVDALLQGVLERDGATAGEFAAMLLYIHGRAPDPYDMAQRPFFLRFQDEDRLTMFVELCARIGLDDAARQRLIEHHLGR